MTNCAMLLLLLLLHSAGRAIAAKAPTVRQKYDQMESFQGGSFFMGVTHPEYERSGEHPIRPEYVRPFAMDRYPVTNQQFSEFVRATRFMRTDPELKGFSYVFFKHVSPEANVIEKHLMIDEPWWLPVAGARWHKPQGSGSSWQTGKQHHPVVHVGAADADSFCKWRGKRLPTEYEWEYAARANNNSWIYPWGDHYRKQRMNTWQGLFPYENTEFDHHAGLAPVDAYPQQNHRDMFDMLGNAWEWTATEYYGLDKPADKTWLILKGGSFVDSIEDGINSLVRVAAKTGKEIDFTAENIGFRCAKSILLAPKSQDPVRIVRLKDTWEFKQSQRDTKNRLRQLQQQQQQQRSASVRNARFKIEL